MALAAPVVLCAINGAAPLTLLPNAQLGMLTSVTLTLSLQSTVGVNACTYAIRAPGTILDGQSFTPPSFVQIIKLGPTPTTLTLTTTVTDGENPSTSVVSMDVTAPGPGNMVIARQFGAKGDLRIVNSVATGTDDTNALQAMLDINNTTTLTGTSQSQYTCKLNATQYQYPTSDGLGQRTLYRITRPLQKNDIVGNTTTHFVGEPGAYSGLYHQEFFGPAIVDGNNSLFQPSPVLDPNGSGEWLMQVGPTFTSTIAAGSNNKVLPQSTIALVTTAGMTTAGQITISSQSGAYQPVLITYSGISGNNLTGCTGGSGQTLVTGDLTSTLVSPWWTLADCSLNDLQSVTNFTVEWFENPCNSTAWINSTSPGSWISSPFGISGVIGNVSGPVASHETAAFLLQNGGSILSYTFRINIGGGSFSVNTSLSSDHTGAANTLHHIAVSYDGAHLRMFVDGAQPDGTMTAAATGALIQQWYEAVSYCSAGTVSWPQTSILPTWSNAPRLMGRIRISNNARYTAPFTAPTPSQVGPDQFTIWYQDFTPASIPARPGLLGFNIGTSNVNAFGRANMPVWLNNHTTGINYTSGSRVKDMFFTGTSEAIRTFASLDAEYGEGCIILGNERGVVFDWFSYNSGTGKGLLLYSMGHASLGNNYNSIEILFGPGCQFSYISDNWASTFGNASFGVVTTNSDITIHGGFPNSYQRGFMAFMRNVSAISLIGPSVADDQTSGVSFAGILIAPTHGQGSRFTWVGGNLAMEAGTAPCILIGTADVPVEINTAIFAANKNLLSAQGNAAGTMSPVVIRGPETAQLSRWSDPANPCPVFAPEREMFGVKTMTPTGNVPLVVGISGYTPTPTIVDQLYREYIIANGGWSGGQNVTWPSNPGKIYQVTNNNTQTATYKTASGAGGQAATTGQKFKIQDQATGMVAI